MKVISVKSKSIFNLIMIILCLACICVFSKSLGMQNYYKLDFTTGLTTSNLNVRSGPGVGYKIVTTISKGQYIRVFAGVGEWYIVQVEGDFVGAVNKKYVKAIYPSSSNSGNKQNTATNQMTTSSMNSDEKEVFDLINKQRTNNGLQPLKEDKEVQRVARIKAQDMVDNNYFSHDSPIYGSPFNMLNSFKISYRTAGENIAGNSSNSSAVNEWMNSPGHKANILNSNFNYTGIGVVNGSKYGKIYVQIFIGK